MSTPTTDPAAPARRIDRDPFTELDARERAHAILDDRAGRELIGPFERFESPHLTGQGIVPQSDDGAVVLRGEIGGEAAVVVSLDGRFSGGGIGEISGAKLAGALELALREARQGRIVRPVLLLETGGIRLQEANLGLLAIADIHAAILALRRYVPVVGVVTGGVGCFGGMGIAAGLCSDLVMTAGGRLGLNGPEVIETEAGVAELDSSDRAGVYDMIGGRARTRDGLADALVADDVAELAGAVSAIFDRGVPDSERSADIAAGVAAVDAAAPGDPEAADGAPDSRGATWFAALTGGAQPQPGYPGSVLVADAGLGGASARFLSVRPDPGARFPRARRGEVGLDEGWALARAVREVLDADADAERKRPVVAVVDVPSQAYGAREERAGIHQSLAAAVDAYASARAAGHPVVALITGSAISGAFLAHGLQADRILSLDDEKIAVQVMGKQAAARITQRTVEEMEEIATRFPATAYDGAGFATLGAVHEVLTDVAGDAPTGADTDRVRAALAAAVDDARGGPHELSVRRDGAAAHEHRGPSIEARERLARQWDGPAGS